MMICGMKQKEQVKYATIYRERIAGNAVVFLGKPPAKRATASESWAIRVRKACMRFVGGIKRHWKWGI